MMGTHEEAIECARGAWHAACDDGFDEVAFCLAMDGYLNNRDAVMAAKQTTAWLIESIVGRQCVNSEISFLPWYAEKSKSIGYVVTPLHVPLTHTQPEPTRGQSDE